MSAQFKIVFTGTLRPHTDPEAFVTEFSKRFKMSAEKARQLMTAGREVVIKQGVPQKQADAYRQLLEGLGMDVRLDPMTPPAAPISEPATPAVVKPSYDSVGSDPGREKDARGAPPHKPDATGGGRDSGEAKNPYAMPRASLVEEPVEGEMTGPVSVPAEHGWEWIRRGFWHFRQSWGAWVLAILAWGVISMVVSLIPFIGSLALSLFGPVIMAGYMLGAREQDKGGDFQFNHLFAGFSSNLAQLVLVGLIFLLGSFAVGMVVALIGMGSFAALGGMEAAQNQDPAAMMEAMGGFTTIILVMLITMALIVPLLMAYWFAPALVALDGLTALSAMKMSFRGCMKNIVPFLIFGVIGIVVMFVAMLPFFLGLLVAGPVFVAATYVGYRDIFYS
ncbi:MAG: hypothetical protein GY731_00265 [Gammaproteobacteria bacterium]|nr:hypothetical protein [Gammaproteobacteria bacterium]